MQSFLCAASLLMMALFVAVILVSASVLFWLIERAVRSWVKARNRKRNRRSKRRGISSTRFS